MVSNEGAWIVGVHDHAVRAHQVKRLRPESFQGSGCIAECEAQLPSHLLYGGVCPRVLKHGFRRVQTDDMVTGAREPQAVAAVPAANVKDPQRPGGRIEQHLPQVLADDRATDAPAHASRELGINFHFAESMPNQQADLVMASLLVGMIALTRSQPVWQAGNDAARANAVLNEGTLLHDFLRFVPRIAPERAL